ncbi:nucleotide sugar dehydrogenase [Phenylobacterium conjunctum]|uniref:UDP-glucose 6-dehydrogenase n=1 Tax=Phenylobacterium conjunctum TaxID=1298959 RepID=A0ABW3T8K0_9CAUL
MRVSVFGIGYVGAVSAACLARDGHHVVAVDVNPVKIDAIQQGRSPIVEHGLEDLISRHFQLGNLTATSDIERAIHETELSLICVGTPSNSNGSLDVTHLMRVSEQIGSVIASKNGRHTVIFRSTMLPGTMTGAVVPALERHSGKTAGTDFGVGYYPEFLREGSAILDYDNPGATVFGALDAQTLSSMKMLQPALPITPSEVDLDMAETIKYFNNAWHALKISFANEVGNICSALNVDGHKAMEILCADTRLNISSAYLKPGFAFGGSCLPKDLRALRFRARELEVDTPLLDGIYHANTVQMERAFKIVTESENRKIGIIGLSFKPDTDDLRESPQVILAERLLGKGYSITIFDPNIRLSKLTGANLDYVNHHLPHIAGMLRESLDEVLASSDTVILAHRQLGEAVLTSEGASGKHIIDLVRVNLGLRSGGSYQGLCW